MDNTIINEKRLLVKQFNGVNIQVYGTYEEPLFKAKDVGDLLEIKNITDTVSLFNNKQKVVGLTDYPSFNGMRYKGWIGLELVDV